jgi:hypothetical protein
MLCTCALCDRLQVLMGNPSYQGETHPECRKNSLTGLKGKSLEMFWRRRRVQCPKMAVIASTDESFCRAVAEQG